MTATALGRTFRHSWMLFLYAFTGSAVSATELAIAPRASAHAFQIGKQDFLLDGRQLEIRCGEMHFARIPREYWRDRLRRAKAMGLNTVCAYLFWNFHEWEPGRFDWQGQADAAEFCRIAQEEGLWVILRPGPYACAEWEMGGLPWWLLKQDVKMRSRDPGFMTPARRWLVEVGRVLGPLQVTRGGPILMVQVENEYSFYGEDTVYLQELRQALVEAGFEVPLFTGDPGSRIAKTRTPADLFKVVNFGKAPAANFQALRSVQPDGPLMCGEFYSGWFDTWGSPHHVGNNEQYVSDLEYMLAHGASFSIYMAHGGTSFGLWSGADRPFKPDTSSYDYDAPIAEDGSLGEKFRLTREVMARHLLPGETLPEHPANPARRTIDPFVLTERADVFANLPAARIDAVPRTMEAYDQGRGAILYRTTLPAGPAGVMEVADVHDFGFVYLDGKPLGVLDRRSHSYRLAIPARGGPAQLDLLVYALGRVNFGTGVDDRKGLYAPVTLAVKGEPARALSGWRVYSLPLDEAELGALHSTKPAGNEGGPAFWHGTFTIDRPADTFLDLSAWGFGVVWVNGHCLGRFWNVGPTQTAYVPGPWLRAGQNEVTVFDLVGPSTPTLAGLDHPLNALRPELDFAARPVEARLRLEGVKPAKEGKFNATSAAHEVKFAAPVEGKQVCFEAVDSHDGKPVAAVAELELLDPDGRPLAHANWTIAYADSEEKTAEDGSAGNAIDGQTANAWVTGWSRGATAYPHRLIVDLGAPMKIGGFLYVPRSGDDLSGRIKTYRIYVGAALVQPMSKN
jgi:beta-galactosidase